MNRLAIFAEGETEQLFAEWLVREMAGAEHLTIVRREARGGVSARRRTRFVEAVADDPSVKYFVLIVDCGGDGGVKSRILEEYQNLARYGYRLIIGLRDGPDNREDIPRLQEGLPLGVLQAPIPVVFILAIMEIEAWFLAEFTHLTRIDARLTPALILERLGFDPSAGNMQLLDRPARSLNDAYQLVGERYQKGRAAERTIYHLDPVRVAYELSVNEPEIQRLIETIEQFLQGEAQAHGQA